MTTRAERNAEVDAILEVVAPLLRAGRNYRIDVHGEQRRLIEAEVGSIIITYEGVRVPKGATPRPIMLEIRSQGDLILRIRWRDDRRKVDNFDPSRCARLFEPDASSTSARAPPSL